MEVLLSQAFIVRVAGLEAKPLQAHAEAERLFGRKARAELIDEIGWGVPVRVETEVQSWSQALQNAVAKDLVHDPDRYDRVLGRYRPAILPEQWAELIGKTDSTDPLPTLYRFYYYPIEKAEAAAARMMRLAECLAPYERLRETVVKAKANQKSDANE